MVNSQQVAKASDDLHRLNDRALVRHERASKANGKLHRLKTTCSWPGSNGWQRPMTMFIVGEASPQRLWGKTDIGMRGGSAAYESHTRDKS